MKISFETTVEQDAALTRSNASANPANPPTLEEFIVQNCNDKINEHVTAWRQRDYANLSARIERLPTADKDAIAAEISTREAAIVAVVDPIIEAPIEKIL